MAELSDIAYYPTDNPRCSSLKCRHMTNIGHLTIISADTERSRLIGAHFEHTRYRVSHLRDADASLAALRGDPPDVALLLDLPAADSPVRALRRLPELANTAIALSGVPETGGADDVIPADIETDALVFRLQPLFRLSTMQQENRLRAPGRVPLRDWDGERDRATRALYLSLDPAATLPAAFLGADTIWESANSAAEAEMLITGPGLFDIIVVDAPSAACDEILGFCRDMRDNPRLFNLPFLVRIPGAEATAVRALYRVGVNRVIATAADAETLEIEARSLIALQNRREAVREDLRRTLTDATGHPRQAVYTDAFLNPYLSRRLAVARAQDRALSVVHLHLPEAVSLREEAGAAACQVLSEQIARWLSRLIRVEDLAARLSDSDFIVVLPDTLPSEAQYVMNRIAGVLTFTDFAVPEVYRPVKVWPLVGVVGVEPDDTAETILRRAHAALS